MAARKTRTTLNDRWREKIQASMLVNRLMDHGLGKCELSATQVRSIEILLKKVAPDLASVDYNGTVTVKGLAEVLTGLGNRIPEIEELEDIRPGVRH